MRTNAKFVCVFAAVAMAAGIVLGGAAIGSAADAADATTTDIEVEGMHCPACAKKIVARLMTVPGVADVQTEVTEGVLLVTPKPQKAPSARAMWEAVEKAGYKPIKLAGPGGVFTTKPKS